jgi:hypothetical protein
MRQEREVMGEQKNPDYTGCQNYVPKKAQARF